MASETPFYDFDGNLVSDARWVYVWNGENQLIEMNTAAPALAAGVPRERYRFVYDSRSRRIARTVERWDLDAGAWALEKNERFIHDDWNVAAVVDAAGEVLQRYVWGNDLAPGLRSLGEGGAPSQGAGGVGGLLAAADAASGRSWCYAYDGNGNVSAVVDLADGAKVGRYDYDAFGRSIATWGDEGLAGMNVYRFSTKPLEGTGLYYYGFRYYQPETGRWLSRDPIEEKGGLNIYSMLNNSQVSQVDVLGLIVASTIEPFPSLRNIPPGFIEAIRDGTLTIAAAAQAITWREGLRLEEKLTEDQRALSSIYRAKVGTLNQDSCQPVFPVFQFLVPNVYKTHVKYLNVRKFIQLTYDGLYEEHPVRRAKRKAAQSPIKDLWRRSLRETGEYDLSIYDPMIEQIDEFPYASTEQGGSLSAANKVPIWENSVHGTALGVFYSLPLWRGLPARKGSPFTVVLIPSSIDIYDLEKLMKYISSETGIAFTASKP
jgi:RHS repeat-associated protein